MPGAARHRGWGGHDCASSLLPFELVLLYKMIEIPPSLHFGGCKRSLPLPSDK